MSVLTPLLVDHPLPDGEPGGEFVTFDADLLGLYGTLRLDADGWLWETSDDDNARPLRFDYDGVLCFQTDDQSRSYAAMVADGSDSQYPISVI